MDSFLAFIDPSFWLGQLSCFGNMDSTAKNTRNRIPHKRPVMVFSELPQWRSAGDRAGLS
jgi:hypothetical protein